MQFITISAALLGLFALASAAPHAQQESGPVVLRDFEDLAARGLIPRSPKKNNKNDVNVVDTTFEQITEVQKGNEVELTTLVEKKITEQSQKRTAKDNIRKNHFAAKNKNQNTVITVVTEIVDARANEKVTRIMTHQVKAENAGAKKDVQVQVTEIKKLTITAQEATKASQNSAAQASASAGVQVQQVAQNAPFLASNATIMLPPGASAPAAQQVEADPAAILEEEQTTLFVSTS